MERRGICYNSRMRSPLFFALLFAAAPALAEVEVIVAHLSRAADESVVPPSRLTFVPDDIARAGTELGVNDNQTTGAFLKHAYSAVFHEFPADAPALLDEVAPARIVVADLPADDLEKLAAENPDALFFNVRAQDDELRRDRCADNVFHVIPSRAMKADALAQYLVWKRWTKWFLVAGERPPDRAFAAAVERAAKKFGADIVEKREYKYEATARRTDTGHMQIQKQLPVFTQDAEDHHILIAADESHVFGEYLSYRAWDPRPVAGTHGLRAVAWHPATDLWGGTQLQRRFHRKAGRWMDERDYAAWLAVRVIGEAVTRVNAADPKALREHIIGDEFAAAGFKGQPLTFRKWNQQLRQPIFVAGPMLVVSVSPQPTFLHQRSHLDSLGFDLPDGQCRLNGQ